MNPTEMAVEMKFIITSLIFLDAQEKKSEKSAVIIEAGAQKIEPNPARCQGAQSPHTLKSSVSIPNNHKIPA